MLLRPHLSGYRPFDERYAYLFNSYYEALGSRLPRAQRGLLSRPALDEIHAYRRHVDKNMAELIEQSPPLLWHPLQPLIMLGLHHEQLHLEFLLTSIVHALCFNPTPPPSHSPSLPPPQPSAFPPTSFTPP